MTYSEEEMNRPVSGGFTRKELADLPDKEVREVMMGRLNKAEWDRRQGNLVPERVEQRMGEAIFGQGYTIPAPAPSQDAYAVTSWGATEYDFVVPSGQRCRLRNVDEQMLLEAGILEQVTRLPGLVMDGPVREGQGKPPINSENDMMKLLRDPQSFTDLMATVNTFVSVVVVLPRVRTDASEENPLRPGEVDVRNINLGDRIAILERAMGDVKKLDNFRS